MVELNYMLLYKMGWSDNRHILSISNSSNAMFFKNDEYKFSLDNYKLLIEYKETKKIYSIDSNVELMKIIIKYNAFSSDYIRHFKINKILK